MTELETRNKMRWRMLVGMCRDTHGFLNRAVDIFDIANEFAVPRAYAMEAMEYFVDNGLAEQVTRLSVCITDYGRKEFMEFRAHPNLGSDHFSPIRKETHGVVALPDFASTPR